MKNSLFGVMLLVFVPTLAQAQSRNYSPSKSVITCLDTKTGDQFRFQVGGNWMEVKSRNANVFTTCETETGSIQNRETVVVTPRDYDLKAIKDFTHSSNGRVGYGVARYYHFCVEKGNNEYYGATSKAEQLNHSPGDITLISNFETLYMGSSNNGGVRMLKFGVNHLTDRIHSDFDCTNLEAPRYSPRFK